MTTPTRLSPASIPLRHRAIVARLDELGRRCHTLASRHQDLPAMETRLETLIEVLAAAGSDAVEPPLPYAEMARNLAPLERLFESIGFLNVARIVANVQEALCELAPAPPVAERPREVEPEPAPEPVQAPRSVLPGLWLYLPAGIALGWLVGRRWLGLEPSMAAVLAGLLGIGPGLLLSWVHRHAAGLLKVGRDQRALGYLIFAVLMVPWCLAGAAAAVLLVIGQLPASPERAFGEAVAKDSAAIEPGASELDRALTGPAGEARGSRPLPAGEVVGGLPRTGMELNLPAEIGEARRALQEHDLKGALEHLSSAALVDPDHALVLETAREIVHALLDAADAAVAERRFSDADAHLVTARELARRFSLDTAAIEATARRHARLVRYRDYAPIDGGLAAADLARLRDEVGRDAVVRLRDLTTFEGTVSGVRDGLLLLDLESDVGGGQVEFVKEIALTEIATIRVFPD